MALTNEEIRFEAWLARLRDTVDAAMYCHCKDCWRRAEEARRQLERWGWD